MSLTKLRPSWAHRPATSDTDGAVVLRAVLAGTDLGEFNALDGQGTEGPAQVVQSSFDMSIGEAEWGQSELSRRNADGITWQGILFSNVSNLR